MAPFWQLITVLLTWYPIANDLAVERALMNSSEAAWRGVVAGAIGTVALTALRRLIEPAVVPAKLRQAEHPPEQIVEWAEERVGEPATLSNTEKMTAAMVLHFGYGAAAGALYGLLRPRVEGMPATLAGAMFGTGVWAVSLEGWLPALGIAPATTDQAPRKWPMPVLEHVTYGVVTALAYDALSPSRDD